MLTQCSNSLLWTIDFAGCRIAGLQDVKLVDWNDTKLNTCHFVCFEGWRIYAANDACRVGTASSALYFLCYRLRQQQRRALFTVERLVVQSFLWNSAASHRIRTFGASDVVGGDLVLPRDAAALAPALGPLLLPPLTLL